MKNLKNLVLPLIALVAALAGVAAMAISGLETSKIGEDTEERFREAILRIEGVTDVQLIITEDESGQAKGVAVVCSSSRDVREEVTKLVGSGLGISSNRIHVVCN